MSIIGCVLIAVIAQRWKGTLLAGLIVGLLGSAVFGLLRWEDTRPYGSAPDFGFMAFYIATGTAAFVAETAAFFAIKLGIRALWIRRRAQAQPPTEADPASEA